ncbi:MAG: M28 family peptidase [Acidobacteriaceae bacterium]|nr:M28 family peptidase [Acidobacteriaceae bacterium]MBV9782090.1 M28 family peptidase [Acidobacteriaceae bacterium]
MLRIFLPVAAACSLLADAPPSSLNPQVEAIVSQVSADRIAEIQKKLESFGTRNIYSATDNPAHGIGAAREWIAAQFRSYSPKLQVSFDKHRLAKQGRAFRNVEIWNIVAVLPGTGEPERQVIMSGHYDSIHLVYRAGADGQRELDPEATVAAPAPGVTDDGSGTAAVMELARVMSQYQFRKSIVFIAFAAEEYGLFGSGLYAEAAAARHDLIEGVFNNDIIGSDVTGNGETSNRHVNVYSEEPNDSSSRQLARYMKQIAERYQPGFEVNLVFRHDRFGRGGDHSPFNAAGYAAIRITTPMENFSNQHTATDTFANTAPAYTALVAKANAAAIAALALAPKAPELELPPPTQGRAFASPLGRGSGYDAVMTWTNKNPEPDLWGYAVVLRKTTSPFWEREIFAGNVTQFTLSNVNIDEVVLGVKAIDKNGNESLVSVFVNPPYQQHKIETY